MIQLIGNGQCFHLAKYLSTKKARGCSAHGACLPCSHRTEPFINICSYMLLPVQAYKTFRAVFITNISRKQTKRNPVKWQISRSSFYSSETDVNLEAMHTTLCATLYHLISDKHRHKSPNTNTPI